MNNELTKSSANSKAFANKSVNGVLISFGLSRENIALGNFMIFHFHEILFIIFSVGDTLIDESLRVPRDDCSRESHETCIHATIVYDESFHKDDQVRNLNFTDSLSIPHPDTCYAGWKMLGYKIEHRKQNEEAAFLIKWGNLIFNVVELNTLKDLGLDLLRTKRDTKMEEEFLLNGKNQPVPEGIIQLDQEDHDISTATEKILKSELTLHQNIPLSTIERTMEHFDPLDNEQFYNFSHPSRQLHEEDLHIVSEICNTESDGKDVFLVFTPEMTDKKLCEDYAVRKGCNSADTIHIIVNVSLAKQLVNVTDQNGHWVYVAIKSEKEVVYGDPLGSRKAPTNLFKVLNPIYRARFGKNMLYKDVKILNCSNNINFPSQTCSTICGLVSAILCICSFSAELYKEIMFSRTENPQLQFIKHPSYFSEQIRMRFIKIVMSRKHCAQSFFPAQMVYNYKEGDEQLGHSYSARKSKNVASKAWESLKSKSRSRVVPPSTPSVVHSSSLPDVSESAPIHSTGAPKSSIGKARTSTPEPPCTMIGEEVEQHNVDIFVKSNFIGLQSFKSGLGYPDNDGFSWTVFCGRKTKGPQKFKCSNEECTALKHVFKSKFELRKKRSKKDQTYPINVNYIAQHTCTEQPKAENVLLSSYWMNRQGKTNEESTHDETERGNGQEVFTNDTNNEEGDMEKESVSNEAEQATNADSPVSLTEQDFAEVAETEHDVNLADKEHCDKSPEEEGDGDDNSKESNDNNNSLGNEIAGWTVFDFSNIEEQISNTNSTNPVEEECIQRQEPHIEMDKEHDDKSAEEEPENNAPETEKDDHSKDSNDNSFSDDIAGSTVFDFSETNQISEECIQAQEQQTQVSHSKETFPCYLCSFVLTSMEDFLEHTTASHGKVCLVCSYGTTTEELLEEHKVEKGHFKCHQCDYKINCTDLLKKHREEEHGQIDHSDTVNDVLFTGKSLKRKTVEQNLSEKIKKKMRISPTIREASPIDILTPVELYENCLTNDLDTNCSNTNSETSIDAADLNNVQGATSPERNVESHNGSDIEITTDSEPQTDEDIEDAGPAIRTKVLENLKVGLDENEGNIAFIINNVQSEKKPKIDRNKFNWGNAQSQRGKTTFYPCNGYFKCDKCQIKAKVMANCTACETPLTHKKCAAKKYVYFCKSNCVREAFKDCCKIEPALRKLVLLYIGEHCCVPVNLIADVSANSKFKQVKTKEDILENIKTHLKNDDEIFSIETVDKVPSDVDGNRYYVLENTKNLDMKDLLRDGRKWQTYTQTSSRVFSNILGESNSKKIRKYSCSNQYFCFNQGCPFKKRFELVNQVLLYLITKLSVSSIMRCSKLILPQTFSPLLCNI